MKGRPHVARRLPGSAIERRTTRHPGYAASQRTRKRMEEAFGWKDHRRHATTDAARHRAHGIGLHLRRRLQPSGVAQAAGDGHLIQISTIGKLPHDRVLEDNPRASDPSTKK